MTKAPDPQHDRLSAAQAGDRAALEALLVEEQARVYRFAMRMCGRREDAEEVAQNTLLTLAEKLGDFRGDGRLSTWTFVIARSFCIKERRRSAHAPMVHEPLEAAAQVAVEVPVEEQVAARQELHLVEAGLASLDETQREVVLLRDVEGRTTAEIAEITGLSPQAVKGRLHRARVQLRDQLADALGLPSPKPGCPDLPGLLSQHLEGELAPSDCAAMEQHLAECGECKRHCDLLRTSLRVCASLPGPAVPPEVERRVRDALHKRLATAVSS